jgi:hypothetical protein
VDPKRGAIRKPDTPRNGPDNRLNRERSDGVSFSYKKRQNLHDASASGGRSGLRRASACGNLLLILQVRPDERPIVGFHGPGLLPVLHFG